MGSGFSLFLQHLRPLLVPLLVPLVVILVLNTRVLFRNQGGGE